MQPAFLAALLAASCKDDEKMWAQLLRVAFDAFNDFSFLDTSSLGGRLAALNVLTQPPQLQAALVRAAPRRECHHQQSAITFCEGAAAAAAVCCAFDCATDLALLLESLERKILYS